jgi:hypothetical protein
MKSTLPQLKEVATICQISLGDARKKADVFARIRNSGNALITLGDSETSFQYQKVRVSGATASNDPYWLVLNPEIPPRLPGIDMATGAEVGFFGPTNTNNIAGAQKHNFLTHPSETIKCPDFASGDPLRVARDDGHPSNLATSSLPTLENARPLDFFNLLLTPRFIEKTMVACTNQRAAGEGSGVGGTVYTDFVPFDVCEMYRFIGLLFANGLAPKPDFTKWFETAVSDELLGNDFIAPLMNKKLAGGGFIPGIRRWKHFRRFLCLYDFRLVTKRSAAKDPLYKVRLLLRHLNKQSMAMWITGKHLSVDEQTIGFKGSSSMSLRISYKKEGDGFQCDTICNRGYTIAFWFRHGEPPELPSRFDDLKLPPTARRVVWLANQLPNKWTRIFMDNLFNSQKLFSALYRSQALAHGVIRTSGRGFPPSIKQEEEKNANRADALRGTTKAAELKNSSETPSMLAVSVYDTKPVHLMSTVSENVQWVVKKRKVWSAAAGANKMMRFIRLNVIDDYNQFMNSTDIADQLRNTYRPDHWMRNRKWWWSFFLWALGVARVNAYKIYCEVYDAEKKKKQSGMPVQWSHREFIHGLILDMMNYNKPTSKRSLEEAFSTSTPNSRSEESTRTTNSSRTSSQSNDDDDSDGDEDDFLCESGVAAALKKYKPASITSKRMKSDYFNLRLNGKLHPMIPAAEAYCQYCRYQHQHNFDDKQKQAYMTLEQNRKQVRRCLICNVNLCPTCELEFHGIERQDLSKYFRGK